MYIWGEGGEWGYLYTNCQRQRGTRIKTQHFREDFCNYFLVCFKTDALFLNTLEKVIITKQQSFLVKWFFLNSHCLCAFVLFWLSSCQPPYGDLPTLTISIFVVLPEITLLREGLSGQGWECWRHDQWVAGPMRSGTYCMWPGSSEQVSVSWLVRTFGGNADYCWLPRDF